MTKVSVTKENVLGLSGIESSLEELLLPAREQGFEMRRLFFAGDHTDFDFFETGRFEPLVQITFGKTQPAVAVELVSTVKFVLQQVKDHDLATGFEHVVSGGDGFGRFFCVMQRLTQNREINAVRFNRRVLDVAATKFEILEIVFLRFGSAESNDFL